MKAADGINEEIWNKFVGYCKMKDTKVGDMLNIILQKFIENEVDFKNDSKQN